MGELRFLTPDRSALTQAELERVYATGLELIPWQTRAVWEDDQLVIRRQLDESASVHFPWRVAGHGMLTVGTTSLMVREQPYVLELELARGALNRLRNQLAVWRAVGLQTSAALAATLRSAQAEFVEAVLQRNQLQQCADAANRAIGFAADAVILLGAEYANQVLAMRQQHNQRLTTLLAIDVDQASEQAVDQVRPAFNSSHGFLGWSEIEPQPDQFHWEKCDQYIAWRRKLGLRVCAGPLLELSSEKLPSWLYLWEDDFDSLKSYAVKFIGETVTRYRGKAHLWHCSAGLNVRGDIRLSEDQLLRLAASSIEAVRRADPRTPVIISFDQPWGEFLAKEDRELSPWLFAETLVRAGMGLSGLGLEINLGYWPGGTLTRDAVDISQQLDRWSALGLPLLVMLTSPSGQGEDAQATRKVDLLASARENGPSPESQKQDIEKLVKLMLSKQAVQGIVWRQVSDAEPHPWPHGGLLDAIGQPKPALEVLKGLRSDFLT